MTASEEPKTKQCKKIQTNKQVQKAKTANRFHEREKEKKPKQHNKKKLKRPTKCLLLLYQLCYGRTSFMAKCGINSYKI